MLGDNTLKDRAKWLPALGEEGQRQDLQENPRGLELLPMRDTSLFPVIATHFSNEETQASPCPGLGSGWGSTEVQGLFL